MKIETNYKSFYNNSVKFAQGIRVQFDSSGKAEVSKEDGDFLIVYYPDWIFPEGQVPVAPVARQRNGNTPIAKETETVEVLKERLQGANKLLNDTRAQLQRAQESERIWRMKCEELLRGTSDKAVKEEKVQAVVESKKDDEDTVLRATLEKKTREELLNIAHELNLPESEYKQLNKARLINYLIKQSSNVNS